MKGVVGVVAPLGVALLVPAASCAASTLFLSSVTTVTSSVLGWKAIGALGLARLAQVPEPISMAVLGLVLFALAAIVRVGGRKREDSTEKLTEDRMTPAQILPANESIHS